MFVTEVPHKCVSTGSARKLCQLLGMFWQIVRSLAELRTFVFVFSTASSGAIPQWQHKWLSDSIKIGYPRLLQWPWTYLELTVCSLVSSSLDTLLFSAVWQLAKGLMGLFPSSFLDSWQIFDEQSVKTSLGQSTKKIQNGKSGLAISLTTMNCTAFSPF